MSGAAINDFDYSTLSLKDLVEARDLYHFHLMSKTNVVGTAVGLYLIRKSDPWPTAKRTGNVARDKTKEPRTLSNSEVRDYSWPCIIVLVRAWIHADAFGQTGHPDPWCAVPQRLYLPDGRVVPVCVVEAPPIPQESDEVLEPIDRPNSTFGGGLPLHVTVQNQARFATIGCLVSDGHTTYALTARHACGEPGTPVSARLRGGLKPIGVSSDKQITRKLFSEVYPALPLRQTWLGLDVGLVRIDDVNAWTPNVYGLPPIKPLFDVYEQNLSLRKLMDQPVMAMGAASGLLQGRIKAMFYRYRSVGGFDYVSDFLIAPTGNRGAHHGDSGAVWFLELPTNAERNETLPLFQRDLRPLAVEWGSQIFAETKQRSTYSVATSLSNVCKLLDVELVVEGSDGLSGTWGAVGHYSIGSLAIGLVKDKTLKAFLGANADLISLPLDDLSSPPKNKDLLASGFVALADVPDIVWKNFPSPHLSKSGKDTGVEGGRDTQWAGTRSTGPEHPNHHCDADLPFDGAKTLPDAVLKNPDLLNAKDWNRYFDSFPSHVDVLHRGILPFRVWQYFERMKDYAKTDPARFIAAAGTLAHYVGDASQPLHGSVLSDGDPTQEPDIPRDSQRTDPKTNERLPAWRGEGVHSEYETQMINSAAHKGVLFPEIQKNLGTNHAMTLVANGRDAAIATLNCMKQVAAILPPRSLIDGYEKTFQPGTTARVTALWQDFGAQTGKVMALGARTLAMIWDSAWTQGQGSENAGRFDSLSDIYKDVNFMRSVTLDEIEAEIKNPVVKAAAKGRAASAAVVKTTTRSRAKTGAKTGAKTRTRTKAAVKKATAKRTIKKPRPRR